MAPCVLVPINVCYVSVTGVGGTEPIEVGLLTGSASSPDVTITGGALTANEM